MCGSLPETHFIYNILCFCASNTTKVAPSSSFPLTSCFDISTTLSIIFTFVCFFISSYSKFDFIWYYKSIWCILFNKCISFPSTKLLILCGSFVDVHSSTILLSSSITWSSAPSISFPPMSSFCHCYYLSIIVTFWISVVCIFYSEFDFCCYYKSIWCCFFF